LVGVFESVVPGWRCPPNGTPPRPEEGAPSTACSCSTCRSPCRARRFRG